MVIRLSLKVLGTLTIMTAEQHHQWIPLKKAVRGRTILNPSAQDWVAESEGGYGRSDLDDALSEVYQGFPRSTND